MLLERVIANHARDTPGTPVSVHLIDPHRPGGGRIWRREQSPLLKLNSMLEDVAFFTDASCTIDGPVAPGPSLAEWVRGVRAGEIARPVWIDAALEREIAEIGDRDFPTRRLNNAYLSWAYDETLRRADPAFSVTWHQDTAVSVGAGAGAGADAGAGVDADAGAAQDRPAALDSARHRPAAYRPAAHRVQLASGQTIDADLVVYTLGHNGTDPSADALRLEAFAARHDLDYVAPAFTAELDLDFIEPGTEVIVRGLGLAAIDLAVMLTGGRGGEFTTRVDGTLAYTPSGREPVLHFASRRGVPYRSKITSRMVGDPVALEYLGAEFHEWLAERAEPLDFERDAWPLIAAELVTGYYRELFTGHPELVVGSWDAFGPALRAALAQERGWDSPQLTALIAEHVPDADHRFDLEAFDRPLAFSPEVEGAAGLLGDVDAGAAAVQQRVLDHIATDLRHRTSQDHSATQALFMTCLFAYISLAEVAPERWNARSRTSLLPRRWHTYFSYLASGPPGHRLEELVALAEAGVVRFLGGDVELVADEERGVFTATGTVVLGETAGSGSASAAATASASASASVTSGTLIDAWLPEARASLSDNALLRQLVTSGRVAELSVTDAEGTSSTGQIGVDPGGCVPGSTTEFALGPFVAGPSGGAFTRPNLNSLPFRIHDRVARAIVDSVERAGVGDADTDGGSAGAGAGAAGAAAGPAGASTETEVEAGAFDAATV